MKYLIVVAHPDDEVLGCGASIYKWTKKGDIVDIKGKVLGRHDGIALYTIGQRKGMGIAAPEPLYVVKLDSQKNQVVVGGAKDVFSNGLIADQVNWVALDDVKEPF